MTSHEFLAYLRALTVIEPHDVPNFEGVRWRAFRVNPFSFLLNAGEIDEAEIWHAVERRVLAAKPIETEVIESETWR